MAMAEGGGGVAAAALAGIKACAAARVNKGQVEAMRCAFGSVYTLCCCWRMILGHEFSSLEVGNAESELERMVLDACSLVQEYGEDSWRSKVLFSRENSLGFLDCFNRMWKHMEFLNAELVSSGADLGTAMEDKVRVDGLLIRDMLTKGAAQDREALDQGRDRLVEERRKKVFGILPSFKRSKDLIVYPNQSLGKGQFGHVYRGSWMGFPVAVKQLPGDDQYRFSNETTILASLHELPHPNVVLVAGTTQNEIVMELMDSDLERFLLERCGHPLPLVEAVDVMVQIANGMDYLHRKNVCYRDLKLRNLLVKKGVVLRVKLADFGESKAAFVSLDVNSSPVGTMVYMAPEILDGRNRYTKTSDVFSFAVTCSEILTGNPLTRDPNFSIKSCSSMKQRLSLYRKGQRPPLPEPCPASLKRLINDCWSLQPEKRPGFEDILKRLWEIKREMLLGQSDLEAGSSASDSSSSASDFEFPSPEQEEDPEEEQPVQDEQPPLSVQDEQQQQPVPEEDMPPVSRGVSGLTITGEHKLGSLQRAIWTLDPGSSYLVRWVRYGPGFRRVATIGPETIARVASSEYIATPDDVGFCIGVECLRLEGEWTRYFYESPVTLDERTEREMTESGHSFNVRINGQLIKGGELQLSSSDYRLAWGMIDRRNFREAWSSNARVELLKEKHLVCKLTRGGGGQVYSLKFDSMYKRNLAVLVMRSHFESQQRAGT